MHPLFLMIFSSVSIGVLVGFLHESLVNGLVCSLVSFVCGFLFHIWSMTEMYKRDRESNQLQHSLEYRKFVFALFLIGAGVGGLLTYLVSYVI